ncbi:DUF6479 family protein [Streptomyces sp. NPDC002886]|uniref:DUF6479 family protein n=1 Tax=Streptomyces sp. NPDC002886 TaxID=3364667 RepID=UPI003687F9F9
MIATEYLAAEATSSLLLIIVGVVVALLLIGAFWYGSRRSARRRAPAQPAQQSPEARARQDSWQTPDGDDVADGPPRT